MDQLETIADYLKKKYQPSAILLGGSRASGKNRPNSDWEFTLFVDKGRENHREEYENQMLDLHFIQLPVKEGFVVEDELPVRSLQIVFDPKAIAKEVAENTKLAYRKGPNPLSTQEHLNRRLRMLGLLGKLEGTLNNQEMFFFHLGTFFQVSIRYWFELRQEWLLPIYEALPHIETKDLEFLNSLQVLAGSSSTDEKLAQAKKIYQRLFEGNN